LLNGRPFVVSAIFIAIVIAIYQVSFALLGWAYSEDRRGWRPALWMLCGAIVGPILGVIWGMTIGIIFR
jgi:hypothetical protein